MLKTKTKKELNEIENMKDGVTNEQRTIRGKII